MLETATVDASAAVGQRRGRALVALGLSVPLATVGVAAALWWWPGTAVGIGLYWLGKVVIAAFPAVWWKVVEGGKFSWSPARRGGFGVALAWAAAIAGVIVVVGVVAAGRGWLDLGHFRQVIAQNHLDNPAVYAGLTVVLSFFNALMEEYFWRWFAISQARQLLPTAGAVLLAAGLFTVHHAVALAAYFPWPMVVAGCGGVFIGGVLWGCMYVRYRSVWPGFVCHVAADLALMGVGGWMIFAAR